MNNNVQPLYGAPAPERLRSIEIIEPDTLSRADVERLKMDLDSFWGAVREQEVIFRDEIKALFKSDVGIQKQLDEQEIKIKHLQAKCNALYAFTTVLGTLFSIIIAGLVFYVK